MSKPKVKPIEKVQFIAKVDGVVVFRAEGDRSTLMALAPKRPKAKGAQPPSIFASPAALQMMGTWAMQIGQMLLRAVGELENRERASPPIDFRTEAHALRKATVHEALRRRGVKVCPECQEPLEVTS